MCGVSNKKLQERLLREPELTLDRPIRICKADEDTRKLDLNKKNKRQYKKFNPGNSNPNIKPKAKCQYCGKFHEVCQCPAYGKKCLSCGKLNHFASVCLTSKRVKTMHVKNTIENMNVRLKVRMNSSLSPLK